MKGPEILLWGRPQTLGYNSVFERDWVWVEDKKFSRYIIPDSYYAPCAVCSKRDNLWLIDDRVWTKLPVQFRQKVLCVKCFKLIVRFGPVRKLLGRIYESRQRIRSLRSGCA